MFFKVGDKVRVKYSKQVKCFILEATRVSGAGGREENWYTVRRYAVNQGIANDLVKVSEVEIEYAPDPSTKLVELVKEHEAVRAKREVAQRERNMTDLGNLNERDQELTRQIADQARKEGVDINDINT